MAADKTLLGQIILAKNWIDEQHLDQYLQVQKGMGSQKIPLGELLVHEGVLTDDQVKQALAIQRKMRQSRIINGYELLSKIGSDLTRRGSTRSWRSGYCRPHWRRIRRRSIDSTARRARLRC